MLGGANVGSMAQHTLDVGAFTEWVEHFVANRASNEVTDAAIRFSDTCGLTATIRAPLVASVRRFQLGESGDGEHLLRKAAAAGQRRYRDAAELFVAEEQQHARLLLHLLGYLGAEPMTSHWSDSVFVRLRRILGLRTELMVLTVAEVIALSYYGGLASGCPDPVARAVAGRILADERAHVRFQTSTLRALFADSGPLLRRPAAALWWAAAAATTLVVTVDHHGVLRAIGYRPRRFAADVFADFKTVVGNVLS
jgi:hypothetical protein